MKKTKHGKQWPNQYTKIASNLRPKQRKIDKKPKKFLIFTEFSNILSRYGQWQTTKKQKKLSLGFTMKIYPKKSFGYVFPNTKALKN